MPGLYQRGATPFHVELMVANQPNFKLLLENLCHCIVTIREDVLSRNQATYQRKLRHFGKNCDYEMEDTTWSCNMHINSTEKSHRMALRFSKIFLQRFGKLLLADTMPNFIDQ